MPSNFFERNRGRHRELENNLAAVLALVLEARGGVGKSTISQIVYETLRYDNPNVRVFETDTANQSMAAIGVGGAEMSAPIAVGAHHFAGHLLAVAGSIGTDEGQHSVVDFGARDEGKIRSVTK